GTPTDTPATTPTAKPDSPTNSPPSATPSPSPRQPPDSHFRMNVINGQTLAGSLRAVAVTGVPAGLRRLSVSDRPPGVSRGHPTHPAVR
ncbi:MAG: hypothetical protein GEV10_20450, partial [Streptosporangiales bacterium]|nr:hypothetical protein [Streptosporangiales bacterium]